MSPIGTRIVSTSHPLRRMAMLLVVLLAAFLLASCTSSSEDTSSGGVGAPADGGGQADYEPSLGEEGSSDGSDGGGADGREFIVTGAMYMTVEDPIAAADEAASIVARAGGRVDARSERAATEYERGWAQLRLRIPAADLDAVTDELRALGTVDELSTSSVDVTREVEDLDARITTLRASTTRIAALLVDAEDITDIITLEDELASRQAELESLEARQRGLADQVSMSTVDLSLTTEPVVVVDDAPRSFWDGVVSGWNGLMDFLAGALVVVGVLLPWLAAGALIALVAFAWFRTSRRRRRDAAASRRRDDAPSPATPSGSEPRPGD